MSTVTKAVFPLTGFSQIVPLNNSGSEIVGFINVLDEEFYIKLTVFPGKKHRNVKLRGRWKLQQLLQPIITVLEQRLSMCDSICDMLKEIEHAIEQQLRSNASTEPILPPVQYYDILLKQIKDVEWINVHQINDNMDEIQLVAIDECDRQHILNIQLSHEFPQTSPVCKCDLPEDFCFQWSANKTLSDLYNQFKLCLRKFCQFWNWMDEVDECTWVLEPERPCRNSCKRRIALAPSVSMLIVIDSTSLSSVPICQFMGPESIVAPLRQKLNENMYDWDEGYSLLSNLKRLLGVEFPSPLTSKKEEFCIACGICYSYKLVEELPDVICSELKCKQPFHKTCLYEWFKSLPTTRHNFNTVFGDCPYCNMTVWFTMPAS